MVIESHSKVQDLLRDRLKKLGYRVLIINDPVRAMSRFDGLDPAENKPADCVVFGTAGLGMAALEAFNAFSLGPDTGEYPAILLVNSRYKDADELKSQAGMNQHHRILELPFKFRRLRKMLRELLDLQGVEQMVENEDDRNRLVQSAAHFPTVANRQFLAL